MGKMFSDIETMAYLRFKTKEPVGWTKPEIVDRRELQETGIAQKKITYETTEPNVGMRRFLEVTCGIPLTYILKEEFMCPSTNKWVSLYNYVIFEEDWPRIKADLLEHMKRGAAKHQK
ncbi:hypothetical protein BGZ92_009479 [Podila epicladia]|nr:hypothetical protein BGZ92_009479 [Podila epicladia]